jgi:hypothetical protein
MIEPGAGASGYQVGDLLRRHLAWYADHYGVYLGVENGVERVVQLVPVAKDRRRALVEIVPLKTFAGGQTITLVERGRDGDPATIRARLAELLGGADLRYLVLGGVDGWNCESAARYVASGVRRTAQGEAAARGAKVGLAVGLGALAIGTLGMGLSYFRYRRRLHDDRG